MVLLVKLSIRSIRRSNIMVVAYTFIIAQLLSSLAIAGTTYDKAQVYDAAKYCYQQTVDTWKVSSITTDTKFRPHVTEDEINEGYVSKFNKIPEADNVIFQSYRLERLELSGVKINQKSENWLIDPARGIRLEATTIRYERNGEPDLRMAGRTEITVLNNDYKRVNMPSNNAGFVYPGMSGDKQAYYDMLSQPDITSAGKPFIDGPCVLENMESIEKVSTPEGDGVKVVFSQDFGKGVGNVFVMWLLPDKGYALHKSEQYMHGQLLNTRTFSDFSEVQSGMWYPMKQSGMFPVRSSLPDDIRGMLRSGELSLEDPKVLQSQQYTEYRIRERTIESISLNEKISDDKFVLDFPLETTLHIFENRLSMPTTFKYKADNETFSDSIENLPTTPMDQTDPGVTAESFTSEVVDKSGIEIDETSAKPGASRTESLRILAIGIPIVFVCIYIIWAKKRSAKVA